MLKRIVLFFLVVFAPYVQAGVHIQHWIAPSGARVYFVESHDLPILDLQVDFDAGSARDSADKVGVASLTQALMDAGANKLDEHAIADKLADVGAQLGGSVDADRAGFTLRVLASRAERDAALQLLSEILAKPTFPAAVLAREKARVVAQLREADTQPGSIVAKRFAAAAYGSHPYGFVATPRSIEGIQRMDLTNFHRRYYVAASAVITLVGDVSRQEAEAIAQQLTAQLPAGAAPPALADPVLPKSQVIRVPHPASQAHVAMGHPALRRSDPDLFPLVVGNYVLGGGGFVSRLMKEVRDARGLSYGVYSYFAPQAQEGVFQIGLETKSEQANEAVKVVNDVLAKFLQEGPSEQELQAAKDNLINGFALRLDNNRKVLDYVAMIAYYKLPLDYLDRYQDKVRAVTAEQIRAAFGSHVKQEAMQTVIVGGKS